MKVILQSWDGQRPAELLLLNQRCGRSDATKRPFLAAPHPRRFIRKQNDSGTYDSTCPICNRTLGSVRIELALDKLEDSHLCLESDLVGRTSAPPLFRAKWAGLLGTTIRSFGPRTPVREGTAAESPDMNTIRDARGGSVSSF